FAIHRGILSGVMSRLSNAPPRRRRGVHSLVIVSSRLRITRDTAVHAARRAGVTPSGSLGRASGLSAMRSHGLVTPFSNRSVCRCRSAKSESDSSAVGGRERQRRNAYVRRSVSQFPPSRSDRRARARAHSRKSGSFNVVSAWSGVLDRVRRTHEKSPFGASKTCKAG